MGNVILTTNDDLAAIVHRVLDEREAASEKKNRTKSQTIHQVAKILGRADATIKKYVETGILKTTIDGRIPETELERFLSASK
jgi:hypothetical protein